MTNYEYLKNVNIEQLSHFLCQETEWETINSFPDDDVCDRCPVIAPELDRIRPPTE